MRSFNFKKHVAQTPVNDAIHFQLIMGAQMEEAGRWMSDYEQCFDFHHDKGFKQPSLDQWVLIRFVPSEVFIA